MIKMLEPVLIIRLKKEDISFAQKLFPELQKEYSDILLKETSKEYSCRLELDNQFLESEKYF
jgi:hypothetical protein